MGEKYQALLQTMRQAADIQNALAVLSWDQAVNMPPGGVAARASAMGTLTQVVYERVLTDQNYQLILEAADEMGALDPDSTEARMLAVSRYDFEQRRKIPMAFAVKMAQLRAQSSKAWEKARANDDFAAFQPYLQQMMDMKRQEAEYLGYVDHPYDALLNQFERGMKTAQVQAIFEAHKPALVALIQAISAVEDRVDDAPVHGHFDPAAQQAFALWAVKHFGFDFERGRQDVAVHPFATSFGRDDVRITTRFHADFLNPAVFGLMHESGHGMYEQGIGAAIDGTPLGSGTSLGVHESQSRMWENLVGRSRGFWQWAYPELQRHFPDALGSVSLDAFYKAINKVRRDFIRVEADEATYNLHIMLRLELEIALIEGSLAVADLPKAWNERFEAYLGIVPPTNREGVLQDVHWSEGLVGYFSTYALGNMLSVQYYNAALAAHPGIPAEIESGKFDTLLGWMRENIHQYGRMFTSDELTRRLTGGPISSEPYMAYLESKYKDIYGL